MLKEWPKDCTEYVGSKEPSRIHKWWGCLFAAALYAHAHNGEHFARWMARALEEDKRKPFFYA